MKYLLTVVFVLEKRPSSVDIISKVKKNTKRGKGRNYLLLQPSTLFSIVDYS